jgi:hypothetical protein
MDYKIWHKEKSVILTKKIGKGSRIHAPVWIGKDVVILRSDLDKFFSAPKTNF